MSRTTSRSSTRQGPSSRRLRRKSTIRSVMAASLLAPRGAAIERKGAGTALPFARVVETRTATEHGQPRPVRRRSTQGVDRHRADQMQRRRLSASWLTPVRDKPSIGKGTPSPHARQERQASSVADLWRVDRDEKARSVVASSRVPRLAGFAGSPPAAGWN